MRREFFSKMTATLCMSVVAISAVVLATNISKSDVQAAESTYKLVWSDEFNGTELNRDNWTPLIGNGGWNQGWGNQELEYYQDSDENIKVSGGALQIIARKSEEPLYDPVSKRECWYTSARLTTTGKQNFKYGKVEARIKLPAIDGLWPAFWMMGDDEPKGWPFCGEIDILETWNTAQLAQGAFHWNMGDSYNNKYLARSVNSGTKGYENFDKTQYHIYGMEWDGQRITWLLDDKEFWTLDVASDPNKADEMTHHFYILLNMAVGGTLTHGVDIDEAKLPATMYVDYVRVYQRTGTNAQYTKKWTEQSAVKKHTVKITDGSKAYVNATVYDGETIVFPEVLTKKGYIFKGFCTSTGSKVTSGRRVRGDIIATAKWEKVKVAKAKISKLKPGKKKVTIKCKASGAKGFQIKYSTSKKFKKYKKATFKGKTKVVSKLKSKKKYYFKARAFKYDSKGLKVYGKWSNAKKVKVK